MNNSGQIESGRSHSHRGTILLHAAKQIGVDVGVHEVEYFRAAALLAAIIDDQVDNTGTVPDVAGILDDPEQRLPEAIVEDSDMVIRAIHRLSDTRRSAWIEARTLPWHNQQKWSAQNIYELRDALADEAGLFSRVFALDAIGTDASARNRFNLWLGHFSRGGYFADTSFDMAKDYKNHLIQVKPTLKNRAVLLVAATGELKSVMEITKGPRVVWELGKTSMSTLRESVGMTGL